MTTRVRSKSAPKRDGLLGSFYARLRALGCLYCSRCQCFMYPDHVQHVTFSYGKVYNAPAVVVDFTGWAARTWAMSACTSGLGR